MTIHKHFSILLLALGLWACSSEKEDTKNSTDPVSNKFSGIDSAEVRVQAQSFLQKNDSILRGLSLSPVEIITDTRRVDSFKQVLKDKESYNVTPAQSDSESQESGPKSLTFRYWNGEPELASEIAKHLTQKNSEEKNEILQNLIFDKPESTVKPKLEDYDIQSAVLECFADPQTERAAADVMSEFNFYNHIEFLEIRLTSGKSSLEPHLFELIGKDGKSLKALNYIKGKLLKKAYTNDQLYDLCSGLEYYIDGKSSDARKYAYYLTKRGSELYPSNYNFFVLLCAKGKIDIIPRLYQALKEPNLTALALETLGKLQGDSAKDTLIYFLNQKDLFMTCVNALSPIYQNTHDEQIIKPMVNAFGKRDSLVTEDYLAFIQALYGMGAGKLLTEAQNFTDNKDLVKKLKHFNNLFSKSIYEVAKDLYNLKLTDQEISEYKIDSIRNSSNWMKNYNDYSYQLLAMLSIQYWADYDMVEFPLNYDYIVQQLKQNCGGKLEQMQCLLTPIQRGGGPKRYLYDLSFIFEDKVYRFQIRDSEYWYDFKSLLGALNYVLQDRGIKERFIPVLNEPEQCYILFGLPESVAEFIYLYKHQTLE